VDFRFSLIGLIIGFLIGLTGMGGGSLMTPVMILIMGVKPLIAVGTDLAYGSFTRVVGGAAHWRQGTVHRKTSYLLAAGSIPATILGVGVTAAIKRSHPDVVNGFVLHALAWALIVVAIVLFAKTLLPVIGERLGIKLAPSWREDLVGFGDRHLWTLPLVGAIAGFMVGLTSVGAGTLVILGLLFLYPRWESKDLVGTDVFHASLLVTAAAVAQGAAGNVNLSMMFALLIGSIPGVLLGSRLAIGFPEKLLRFSLASVILISGAKLL
jgi:uncharacterized membrane protein YfcA